MKKLLLFALVIGFPFFSFAQTKNQDYPSKTHERLKTKNFYLFSAVENDAEIMDLLKADKQLGTYWKRMTIPLESFPGNGQEIIAPFLWSEDDIQTVGKRLVDLSKGNAKFQDLINTLRASKQYANFEKAPDDEYLFKVWEQCAKGLDTVLEVYGEGKMPFYRNIDSVSFDAKSKRYLYAVSILRTEAIEAAKETQLFFQPSLNLALNLLYANHKDEAARYDPLDQKENAKAIQAIKNTDFESYPYGSILVLGGGPENYRDKLSIAGKVNLQWAMKEYRAKKAPFIMVSGGHVHPYMTPYCEAVEMKQELIEEYGVPEENIIIEPYARHTTTNMRNATRLMVDYGIPLDQKSLVVTNPSHSEYTGGETFKKRCQDELGYQPVDFHDRLSPTTLEFTGNMVSLHQNPNQPLDP
ncbi:YdcF family protein [Allomuricauda taeanensis]|uniref:YdcF family protein n=1 Tax=Flagellimonas taeanensis TaxID=1005926 RepID=UPI002E7B90D7|nr:YdcF family protein [Allomuricauda taeanensis]MEE1964357.1 YdcF family protein [Allomuricauda taeanensis]